ncbi:uncharacterized protein LOC119045055 [Artibeus jamaicensis]|uniref:uncharacterized protein LOC119045055 n=1 Tax=Artibeus jamaicensis TaxID=9417 RepID=UPI00235AA3AA|nr:uncharacterized protein LOC119045055 [Artibeus jamaicensis]
MQHKTHSALISQPVPLLDPATQVAAPVQSLSARCLTAPPSSETREGTPGGRHGAGAAARTPSNCALAALVLPLSSPGRDAPGEPGHALQLAPASGSAEDEGEGELPTPAFFSFGERELERGTDRQTLVVSPMHPDQGPLICLPTKDQIHNPTLCVEWEIEPKTFGFTDDAPACVGLLNQLDFYLKASPQISLLPSHLHFCQGAAQHPGPCPWPFSVLAVFCVGVSTSVSRYSSCFGKSDGSEENPW